MKPHKTVGAVLLALILSSSVQAHKLEITEEQRQGLALLRSAMAASAEAEYACVVANPFPDRPEITEARCFRRPWPDGSGVDLRLELFKGPVCYAIFLQNREGQFAVTGGGEWAVRGGEFTSLFLLEHLFADFYHWEMDYNLYRITDATYQGIPCHRMLVTMPALDELPRIMGLTGVLIPEEAPQSFMNNHPYAREFLIGRNDRIIYARKHYNSKKKLIYSASLGKPETFPDWKRWPGLFDTPENIRWEVSQEQSFYDLLQWEQAWRNSRSQHRAPLWPRIADFLLSPGVLRTASWILGLSGALILVFAFLCRKLRFGKR